MNKLCFNIKSLIAKYYIVSRNPFSLGFVYIVIVFNAHKEFLDAVELHASITLYIIRLQGS